MNSTLTVGGLKISVDEATDLARPYLSGDGSVWAYPAYDAYPGHPGPEVGRADLLAVALLNAQQRPLESYYGLESLLPLINGRLADLALQGTLAKAEPATLKAIARLYGILDEQKPKYVGLTKLSKVLHRKRPELLPLYDKNIWKCYAAGDRIPRSSNRSWYEYSKKLLEAMQSDLNDGLDAWHEIANLAAGPKVSPLRALDIVGWNLGRQIK
ncbi:DUF6308 family protein [Pseudarthrobacter sp. J1738]|uniref:DUF6308 family protein n=1 Tax=Pseudarthrobacter sp. J1738 TaxID=3420446 RepID=UPI003D2DDB87